MASFFWQATFPISHITWACGSMAQKFSCSLQSIVPCSLVMLWLGRHPIPSLPPPWQMLFPGMLIASKENVKLKALRSGHLAQEEFEGNRNWNDVAVTRPTKKRPWEQGKAFLAARVGERHPRETLSHRVHLTALQSHAALPSPRTILKGEDLQAKLQLPSCSR